MQAVSTEKLMSDMRLVVDDAEALLQATAGQTGEKVQQIRERAEASLRIARARLEDAGRAVNGTVHEHPWTAAGVAAGVGLVVGLLIGRNKG